MYFRLVHKQARDRACDAIRSAPDGYIVRVSEPTRSLEQNAALWGKLEEVSERVEWYGQNLAPEDWKHIFTAALRKSRVVPGIDGGFVVLGQSTSKMTKSEMSDLLELINSFLVERA
jgi:hypothetical protein